MVNGVGFKCSGDESQCGRGLGNLARGSQGSLMWMVKLSKMAAGPGSERKEDAELC